MRPPPRLVILTLLAALHGAALGAQGTSPPAAGETPAAVEARLPTLHGVERARALASLVDALKNDDPRRALAYGAEAIRTLATHPDPATHAAALNEMGWAYMVLGRYDSATATAEAARVLAERTGHPLAAARALSNLGSLAQRRGDPRGAEAAFQEALAIQRREGASRDIANSLNNLGFVYSTDLADYDRALSSHLEALRLREQIGDRTAISLSLNNIGIVYARLRQYDRALSYYERALTIRRALGSPARVAATLDNIGSAQLDRGDAVRALATHRESLAIRTRLADRAAVAMAYRNVANTFLALGRPDSAHAHLLAALRESEALGDKALAVRNHLALAAVQRARRRAGDAVREARLALALAEAMQARELVRRAWEEVAAAEELAGRPAAALAAHRRFKAVSDSIYDETTARRVADLERRYDAERREREIERLRRNDALLQLEASRRTTQRNTVAALAALLGVAGLAAYRSRVQRTRLAEGLSLTDSLTGAWNRRYVEQTVAADLAGSLRRHRAAAARGVAAVDSDLVFLLLDLDHFKGVNDSLGHAAGDRLLVEVAGVLRRTCRESDAVVRWGGEEFLVLSRDADRTQAPLLAERLREAVAAHVTRLDGGRTLRATCSVGYAVYPLSDEAPDPLSLDQMVALADHAVYAAKSMGRDAWVGYTASPDAPVSDLPTTDVATIDAWIEAGWLRRATSRDATSRDAALAEAR